MKINLITIPQISKNPECLVIGLAKGDNYKKHPSFKLLTREDGNFIIKMLGLKNSLDEKKPAILFLPSDPSRKIIFISISGGKSWNGRRRQVAIRKAVLQAKDCVAKHVTLFLDDFSLPKMAEDVSVRTAAENILMADFSFTKYKEVPKDGWPEIKSINMVVSKTNSILEKALADGVIVGNNVNHCRILSNTPGGDMTPEKLSRFAAEEVEINKSIKVTILNEKEIGKLGMGGVIGVSRGSAERPKFIIMEYWGAGKGKKPIVFVGKGVTFDTGGLNLKPSDFIYEMHLDMSGGAAVINALSAIAKLKLRINVVGIVPAVENMPSGSSYHPGDVLKSITGKTIEVINTDAEGRIILADGLGYAQKYKPELIIDVATLTGAAVVALGQRVSALFANDEKLESLAISIGERSGDEVWPLPLWDEYADDIRGTFGDVANIGKSRNGGAIDGAIFLKQFVGGYPWIHLDIAPTMTTIEGQNLAKGASGVGVRFLVELAREYSKR